MRRWTLLACALVAVLITSGGATGAGKKQGMSLDMYRTTVGAAKAGELARQGYDIAAVRRAPGGVRLDLVLSKGERAKLASAGVQTTLMKDSRGRTVAGRAALQAAAGYNVWRSWDEAGGIRDELVGLAKANPQIAKLEVIGQSLQGRQILALKLTQGAKGIADGRRPAVFYMSNIHAREWISVEVNRRLLHWYVDKWRANDREVKNLLKTRELWFVISANPDGYQYTFDTERLWRKNLHDNDGDAVITNADGVDLNRNFDVKWGYDEEGSSSQFSSETFRGTGPASEPETKAIQGLIDRLKFKFLVTYHSYGPLLLYAYGWQVQTPSADDPLYVAYTGTDAKPAVLGFDPGVGADLYVTNGTTDDYSYTETGALSWTPELEEGCDGCGFVFPDDEALVQAEFEKNLPFALDLARSAPDPSNPVSHLGNSAQPFYLDMAEFDPEKTNNPGTDFTFTVSYGDPQPVRVLAKRSLGAVKLMYKINGGSTRSGTTSEWAGGERYGGGGVYYHVVQGQVSDTTAGDTVQVWFEARRGTVKSASFSYKAELETGNDVLVLSAEDYSGKSPGTGPYATEPLYLDSYLTALADNEIGADVYDVDAHARTSPSQLGVLSHYDAVVWYTGEDVITRELTQPGGTASRLANDEMLAVRAFLNEGGRLLYTGKWAGVQYAQGYEFDIENNLCGVDPAAECLPLSDDFLQYYLGAYILNFGAGMADENPYDVNGVDTPFESLSWGFNGDDSAGNQDLANSFITTSGILPAAEFPQFTSWPAAKYSRPLGPFDPHTGSFAMYSQIGDKSYKRLTRTIDVPETGSQTLTFWTSYDTEEDWDYLFVEARTPGGDDWTTLPSGHTSTSTGPDDPDQASCPAGWGEEIHPHLAHYQTHNPDDTCTPAGTSGTWNAASGSSGGWEEWTVDLSGYAAGGQVEISIAYVSDWGTQGLGVFVDDITTPTGDGSTSFEDDADVMDGWAVSGPAEGSPPNPNNFERIEAGGFPEAAVVATDDTLYMGFGFEGITDADVRKDVMGRAMEYLLR